MTRRRVAADLGGTSADLVVVGSIAPLATRAPRDRGMAVAGGRLIFVGDARSAQKLLRPGGRLIELQPGETVLPGLIDSHVHMLNAGIMRRHCLLDDATTKADALRTIADHARVRPDLPWVIGRGWALNLFDERGPTATELDAIVPDRPAVLYGQDGHSAWVNSRALAAADIGKHTADPRLGRIERDATGQPSGTLRESAMSLVEAVVPQPSTEEWLAGLRDAQGHLHAFGVTMIQDANVTPRMLEVYHEAARSGALTMKVVAAQSVDPGKPASQVDDLVGLRDRYECGRVSAGTAKIFMDGVLEARTAAVLSPYLGGNDRGILNWEDADALAELASRLDRAGFQMHLHAIGDRAVRAALDTLAATRSANGPSDNRHHIAHLELVAPSDARRFRALGVVANFQPFWMFPDEATDSLEAMIGPERRQRLYPMHSIARTGSRIAAGSDWPVSTANPFLAIQVGMTRQSPEPPHGRPWIPGERVSRRALLAAYTTGGAFANHRERDAGSLEVGKAADFIVVDRDLLTIPAHEIGQTRVLNTFVDGIEVHGHR